MNVIVFTPMELLKAKKMPVGTISRGRKKIAEGKWVPVSKTERKAGETKLKAEKIAKEYTGELGDVFDYPNQKGNLAWIKRMSQTHGPGTVRRALRITLDRLKWAQDEGYTYDDIDKIMRAAHHGEETAPGYKTY